MRTPDVSVVMGVYNGADSLGATLDSILSQEGCDIEFIVVNDGSTDDTGPILDEWAARDARLRVIHQANAGLTRSLINGCEVAQSEFIARQDAGDVSLPGRLAGQWKCLRQRADVVLVACATQFIGPADELLYEVVRSGHDLEQGLSALDVRSIKGPPHHGGTMFRKSAYARAGGYRPAFVVAQDIDLWLRLVELGRCEGMEQPLYRARLEANSISGRRRAEQVRLAELAIGCAKRRRGGMNDQSLLDSAMPLPAKAGGRVSRSQKARFYYFVASCLRKSDPGSARRYYIQALREQPLFLRAMIRIAFG